MADMQTDINRILNDFAAQLLKVFREAVVTSLGGGSSSSARSLPAAAPKRRGRPPKVAAAAPVAAAAKRKASKRGPKSTPQEVEELQGQILEALKGGAKMSSSDLVKALKVDPGPFQYALGKLKTGGQVSQLGERRMAKYSLGSTKKAKGGKKSGKADSAGADAQG
jgi:hypothetical protein